MKALNSKRDPLTGKETHRYEWKTTFVAIIVFIIISFALYLKGVITELELADQAFSLTGLYQGMILGLILGLLFMIFLNIKLTRDLSNLDNRATFDKSYSKALSTLIGAKLILKNGEIINNYGERHWEVFGGIEVVGSGASHVRIKGFGQNSTSDKFGEGFSMDISIKQLAKYAACGMKAIQLELQRKVNERYSGTKKGFHKGRLIDDLDGHEEKFLAGKAKL